MAKQARRRTADSPAQAPKTAAKAPGNSAPKPRPWLPTAALALLALLTLLFGPGLFPQLLSLALAPLSASAPPPASGAGLVAHVLAEHGRSGGGRALPQRAARTAPRPVLAYVTPWNARGYDVAKEAAGTFTHVAPVWLQASRTGALRYAIGGQHDVDAGWVRDVKREVRGRRARVVPRVIVEGMAQEDYMALFTSTEEQMALAGELTHVCEKHGLDGIVLELWSRLNVGPQLRPVLHALVKLLGNALHDKGLQLILVVPPVTASFGAEDLHALAKHVDLFSINTYDYSPPTTAGPNAPYDWVRGTLEALKPSREQRAQLLLGLNFYGNLYGPNGGSPVVGEQYISLLQAHGEKNMEVTYNARAREHLMRFTSPEGHKATLYYPTQRSIAERVALAAELGAGICIWEIGQGLDHFYEEL